MEELYKTLGDNKSREVLRKYLTLSNLYDMAKSGTKSPLVAGKVYEGIAKDFIREFLPAGFGLKNGLIFDAKNKRTSPQIDAIIYKGVPLLEFTDVAVVEKEQVKAIFEIKAWIDQPVIFGTKRQGVRNPNSGLAYDFKRRRDFLPAEARYVLFAFNLGSGSSDAEVIERLNSKEVCHYYAVIIRWEPKREQKEGKEPYTYNFDNSVSELIKWLRNLS